MFYIGSYYSMKTASFINHHESNIVLFFLICPQKLLDNVFSNLYISNSLYVRERIT